MSASVASRYPRHDGGCYSQIMFGNYVALWAT
jgi:hypothetical protein